MKKNKIEMIPLDCTQSILDVDPVIIASMKERLQRANLINKDSPPMKDQKILRREKDKLKRVFRSLEELKKCFSSVKNIQSTQREIGYEGVDRKLLTDYAYLKSCETNVDQMDFFRFFLFDAQLVDKQKRVRMCYKKCDMALIFKPILENYEVSHFDFLKLTTQAISESKDLQEMAEDQTLDVAFDQFLSEFYRLEA